MSTSNRLCAVPTIRLPVFLDRLIALILPLFSYSASKGSLVLAAAGVHASGWSWGYCSAVTQDAEISCSPIAEYAIRVIMEAYSYTLVMLVIFGSSNGRLFLV